MPETHLDSEISLRGIVVFGIALVFIVVVATALMWWLSLGLRSQVSIDDPLPMALPEARSQQRPEGPLLQTDPIGELRRMREDEEAILNHAEWVDETTGTVRLPIEMALEAVAAKGTLPHTASSSSQSSTISEKGAE